MADRFLTEDVMMANLAQLLRDNPTEKWDKLNIEEKAKAKVKEHKIDPSRLTLTLDEAVSIIQPIIRKKCMEAALMIEESPKELCTPNRENK
jgi:hypothetical protein